MPQNIFAFFVLKVNSLVSRTSFFYVTRCDETEQMIMSNKRDLKIKHVV
ncbi:hypothetical protein HanOQP8_Chr08g0299131 [Helianthus annuus]|nr:hypothetical protein HanLR1_Chr08g0291751 [Helianthus annuus]KAJ0723503.1 hypothetical protein HanOQP8_Chr08g0299131 [Helianthus annuus]